MEAVVERERSSRSGAGLDVRLARNEGFADVTGADDGREWVAIRNAGSSPVSLACYVLGSGSTSYTYSIAQLPALSVPAGGCVVIGGPDCGAASCGADLDFEPDLHNGPSTAGVGASGVALFHGLLADVSSTSVPLDAVLYGGTNTAGLLDESGSAPASADVADAAGGSSISRAAAGTWEVLATPTPGACAAFTP